MTKYYRITYNNKGIYNELKNNVNLDTWNSILSSDKIKWLPKPPSYAENNKSFFTEKGYKKFIENVLPLIEKYLNNDNITISSYSKVDNIIYEDEYQVIISEKKVLK